MIYSLILALILNAQAVPMEAQTAEEFVLPEQQMINKPPEKINEYSLGVKTSAPSAIVIDLNSGQVLFQKESDQRRPIASITKLMSSILILENGYEPDKEIVMSRSDETQGAYPHIYRGEKVRMKDLLYSALISSDNNSIKAMIRSLGFREDEFVSMMNEKALYLGMKNTEFSDPVGLDENNLSTAKDIARLNYFAFQKEEIKKAASQSKYSFKILNSGRTRHIESTNKLLDSYLNSPNTEYSLLGGKTGYLDEAGYCLTTQIQKSSTTIITVVLGSEETGDRFQDTKALSEWTYSNYEW